MANGTRLWRTVNELAQRCEQLASFRCAMQMLRKRLAQHYAVVMACPLCERSCDVIIRRDHHA